MCKLIANWLIDHMMKTFQLMKNNKLWLTVHSLCVNVELCNRAVTSRVKGSDGDAAVPRLHHQERCHIRHVPYLRQLLLPLWLVAHLICKDTTSRAAGVTVLWGMGWKLFWKCFPSTTLCSLHRRLRTCHLRRRREDPPDSFFSTV